MTQKVNPRKRCKDRVVKYLIGERKSSRICTTMKYAKKLEKEFQGEMELKPLYLVNKKEGLYLYMFEIIKH